MTGVRSKEDVLRMIEEEDVEFIRLQFTDLFGMLKNIAVTASELESVLENGCSFDAAMVDGFESSRGLDCILIPDYSTFEIFPWRPQQGKVARLLCNVCLPNGIPFEGDSRSIMIRAVEKAAQMGYTFSVGPECEFFLFETDENANPTVRTNEQAGYFDVGPLDGGENARRDIVMTLEDMGFSIVSSHHEKAPAQHEIDLNYQDALQSADDIQTFKLAVRTIAKRHGLHATFMPKPKNGVNGSGMHINMSLRKDGKNVFWDAKDENGLSKEAYYFIGGLMKHMKAMAAVTNPLVNSYKRLIPGFGAPVDIAWSTKDRNQMIRVPFVMKPECARIELRSPDMAANPYLTLALCLMAGLDGIQKQIMPSASVDRLPSNLMEAVLAMEADPFIADVLGKQTVARYAADKKKEWNAYITQVSAWELDAYLNRY